MRHLRCDFTTCLYDAVGRSRTQPPGSSAVVGPAAEQDALFVNMSETAAGTGNMEAAVGITGDASLQREAAVKGVDVWTMCETEGEKERKEGQKKRMR